MESTASKNTGGRSRSTNCLSVVLKRKEKKKKKRKEKKRKKSSPSVRVKKRAHSISFTFRNPSHELPESSEHRSLSGRDLWDSGEDNTRLCFAPTSKRLLLFASRLSPAYRWRSLRPPYALCTDIAVVSLFVLHGAAICIFRCSFGVI